MNFDFSRGRITLVISPTDMRCGFNRLAGIALSQLNIQISRGRDFVVFVSRDSTLCKMIWADERGSSMLTRRLHARRFERFLARIDEAAIRPFTYDDLCAFLDGERIMVRRERIHEGK